MLITAQRGNEVGSRSEVGSLSPAERLVGFETRTLRFLLQRLNPLGHSPLQEKIGKY